MRQRALRIGSFTAAIATLGGVARADAPKPKPIEIKNKALDVYRDEAGGTYAWVAPANDQHDTDAVFYGDDKGMYKQRVPGFGNDGDGYEFAVWSPFVGVGGGAVGFFKGAPVIRCTHEMHDYKPLKQLPADQAKAFVAHTKFYAPLLDRQPYFFGRDQVATYYLVDKLDAGKGWRLLVGKKGAMKELALASSDVDSGGAVFAGKSATLSLAHATGSNDVKATWIVGERRTDVGSLDVDTNGMLVYRDLGVYGRIAAICEKVP